MSACDDLHGHVLEDGLNPFSRWLRGWSTKTEGKVALWGKATVYSGLFFSVVLVLSPWVFHRLIRLTHSGSPASERRRRSRFSFVVGSILGAAGLAGWTVTTVDLVHRGKGTPLPQEAPQQLVTDGLYRVVRNPMIVSELLLIGGEACYFESLGVLLYGMVFFAGSRRQVCNIEEPVLRERFGESYNLYCQTVPRWLPRLGMPAGTEAGPAASALRIANKLGEVESPG